MTLINENTSDVHIIINRFDLQPQYKTLLGWYTFEYTFE